MDFTKAQMQIYKMSAFAGGSIANVCGSMLLKGRYDVEFLKEKVNILFELNDGLRIQLYETPDGIKQRVVDYEKQDVTVLYFSEYDEFLNYATEYAKIPISDKGYLCEIQLVILPDRFGIIPKMHHLIGDAWAIALIGTQFNTLVSGSLPQAFSFATYIDKEREYQQSKRYENDAEYFGTRLRNFNQPVYISNINSNNFTASRKTVSLNIDIANKIKLFASKNECSVFSVFFSAFSIYFSRIKANSDSFCIGTTVLNRSGTAEKNTIGSFVNTVPVFIELNNIGSFTENLEGVESEILKTLRHQRYNYQTAIESLNDKEISYQKPFDIIFSYQNAKISGAFEESLWLHNGMQIESLQIHIEDRDNIGNFKIHYDYQTDKFSEKDIDNLHSHFCNLVKDAIENPEKTILELNVLSDEESRKILCEFNDTSVEYQRDKCVHQLFEEQVEKNPDKIAVVAVDKTLTYKELNEEANRIASALIEKGIKPNDFVCFDLKRKSYLFSAMLGIIKSGAAFIPINNDYPDNRKRSIIDDSAASYVISENNIEALLKHKPYYESTEVNLQSKCYAIYTSGSTGTPKGALITHENVLNLSCISDKSMMHSVIKKGYKKICSLATVGFDMFISESILPLLNGMTVIFADEEQSKNPNKTSELFNEHKPDIFQCTPTKLKLLTSQKSNCECLKLVKCIIIGGENFDVSLFKKLKNITKSEIFNFYGPTETTVWVTNAQIENTEDISIGKPMANTQIYIVDKYMKPVPIGVTGELCIAGDCVGAGYLNRPELTAEKFIDNPFGEGKMYKTGDLAYWRQDGNIVFCGRNDFQVKIRGLRIELGEIENAISGIDGIVHSVAVVRKDKEERQYICAFYTGEEKPAKEIREIIGERLPKYMLPHIFTYLPEMPLTSSGKTDRNRLPEVDLEHISTEVEYVAPKTEQEKLLAECICNVMDIGKVSVLDNFFDIGGDSLKAIELTAKLEELGYTAEIKTIFSCKDIRELAKKLEAKESREEEKTKYGSVLPATAAQMRVYTSQMLNSDSAHYNIPSAFKAKELEPKRLEEALNKLIERHESLRTHFENIDGNIVQVIEDTANIKLEKLESDEVKSFNTSFNLSKAPLIKAGYYKNTVIIIAHHIIADGESLRVIFRELNELYMGRKLPATVQYGEFAIKDGYSKENEKYWLDTFSGELPVLNLKTDFSRPEIQTFNGSQIYELLGKDTHNAIIESCKAKGITPYVYYMAGFSVLLSKLTAAEDIIIGTPISGRTSKYLDTVGMFVNTVALKCSPKANKTISELLYEIKTSSIKAIENQYYPFGELVKNLKQTLRNRNPVFDVMLSYQSENITNTVFGDEEAIALPVELAGVKCDINLNIIPRKNELVLMIEYCTDLFKEETIKKLISTYKNILIQILDETILIKDIDILPSDEKQKILCDFNDTDHGYSIPEASTLFSLFEKTAQENKEKVCIKTSDKNITFGELLNISENLDMAIRHITKGKKSIVAVIAERSVEMYASVYGIIRGGNAYLPIDPEYPQERIDYIINNSGASAVLAQGKFVHLAKGTPCINVTEFLNNHSEGSAETPICAAQPDDTAYVIYTSGSTGNPKGAKISHRSIVNRIMWMHDKYPLCSDDVVLQKTPYTFDVSVWELFWWGMCGASLCASKPGEHFLPARILDEVYNNKVTHLHFVPSVFELFLNYLEAHTEEKNKFNSVKYVFLSGEALSANLVQRFYKIYDYSDISLHNLYGPTECAVDVTYYDCIPTDTDPVPIGKPIYNTQMYVVDKYMKPVPIGVTGELCIAGANVGQGYLNNPELNSKKFIPNPFGAGLLYKTGDNAYWRDDGQLIFCGRIDGQIKLNGQRIEIGEIEATISEIPHVESAAVIVKNVNSKDILVAFYTGYQVAEAEIKEACLKTLPKYMVPGVFVHLDALPLNQSGKLNRKELSDYTVKVSQSNEQDEPINEDERFICEIFKSVLGTNSIGRNSDFFESGGTSLSMISALSENGLEKISSSEFIRNSTPAKLAVVIQERKKPVFKHLEPLYVSEESDKVLLLIPYAGGGPESYSNFVATLKNKNKQTSVYFLRYLHSVQECKKAAEEISAFLEEKEIFVYSHCVGSAVALQILKHLEELGKPIKHYLAGASIPPSRPTKKNIWNIVPDKLLKTVLSKAGAQLNDISEEKLSVLLKRFRKDTDFANISYFELKAKIKVPTSLIISQKDMFTKNYNQAEKIWKKYVASIDEIYYIESDSHYFQSDNAKELMEIFQSVV